MDPISYGPFMPFIPDDQKLRTAATQAGMVNPCDEQLPKPFSLKPPEKAEKPKKDLKKDDQTKKKDYSKS